MPDILTLPENTLGKDFVIGDVHGAHIAFDKVVRALGPHDRLLIVGDLVDRGDESEAILLQIIDDKQTRAEAGLPQRIYSIRGNHEDMLLDVLNKPDDESAKELHYKNKIKRPNKVLE